ncbi:hypothetical protein CFAM422_009669 [Trichoderma lentiforme]|uniref:Uncharacterized protein n=1 Tax=Trichoderma lentiforme TaxID=1567552 RepID=A0A9P4X9I0_9HYPO|nr:hypothetical protein CFAM422_009669 [Trichoderma lentiforme]
MSVTLYNTTSSAFNFTGNKNGLHDPPQQISPGDEAEIRYTPGQPSVMWYIDEDRKGQVVVEVGNHTQGNKLWGEGAFSLRQDGRPDYWVIVTE